MTLYNVEQIKILTRRASDLPENWNSLHVAADKKISEWSKWITASVNTNERVIRLPEVIQKAFTVLGTDMEVTDTELLRATLGTRP